MGQDQVHQPGLDSQDFAAQGNRVLNAGGPISRLSRESGNPNLRLPSHPEPKEALPLPLPLPLPYPPTLDQFCVLTNKTRLPCRVSLLPCQPLRRCCILIKNICSLIASARLGAEVVYWTRALSLCAPKTGGKDRVGQNGTIWDGNRDFWPIRGNSSYGGTRFLDTMGQNGTAVGKFCPVQRSNCPPRVRHSRIAVLDSCAATESPQPVATALHRQGNRVLSAGSPINRHSRACGNPNPRLPSHQELKEATPFRPILYAEK